MSVNIFDPIEIINNNQSSTAIPNLEELMIYVNFKAFRRGSTEVIFDADGFVDINSTSDMEVDLMGKDPQTKHFTTNWSNNFVLNDNNYEGFGITDIKITTNSSYIPQVTVEFIDIRGMNFLNKGENSPYSVLYDFPPPIFELVIKGYYGKPLKYSLHLTKQNTRFDSSNGNYYITVDFIANTFAPLTDILFKYVEMFPLIHEEVQEVDLSPNNQPKTTYELINKLQNLYQQIEKNIKTSNEFKEYKNKKDETDNLKLYVDYLNRKGFIKPEYKDSIKLYKQIFNSDETYTLKEINNINEYASNVQGLNTNGIISIDESRLLIVFLNQQQFVYLNMSIQNNIIDKSRRLINVSDLKKVSVESSFIQKNDTGALRGVNFNSYNAFDITMIYTKVFKTYYKLKNDQDKQFEIINEKIEERVRENLGFRPTVRNIIKIICDDVDRMFNILKNTHIEATNHHRINFETIINKPQYADISNNTMNSFPLFIENKKSINSCNNSKHRVYPKNSIFKDIPFPETQLVDDFINIFLDVRRKRIPLNIKMETNDTGNIVWIPINSFDSNLNQQILDYKSPYTSYHNKGSNNINNILNIFLDRMLVLSQYSYYDSFFIEKDDKLINLYAKSEALNLVESISEGVIIDGLLETLQTDFDDKIIKLSNNKIINDNIILDRQNFIINKNKEEFQGLFILEKNQVEIRVDGGTSPIDVFMEKENKGFWNKMVKFFKGTSKFSKENILIIEDNQDYLDNLIFNFKTFLDRKKTTFKGDKIKDFIRENDNIVGNFLIYSMFGRFYLYLNYKMNGIYKYPTSYIKSIMLYCNLNDDQINILKIFMYSINMTRDTINIMFEQLNDIRNNISQNDLNYLDIYYNINNIDITVDFLKFYDDSEAKTIENLLNNNSDFTDKFTEINYLVINSELTFNNIDLLAYDSYSTLINDTNKSISINKFINTFKSELKSELNRKKKIFNKEQKEFFDSIDDDDIKTQTYYSIKNIVDKWVRGFEKSNGYPFNIGDNGSLNDKFVFVDRAMNDIGDSSIIDARSLIEMSDDIDINVFTVISRLLSQNGFEFFPLQNFMNFEGNQWEDSFKIYNNITTDITSSPAFVCMYIGGTSSTLNTNNSYIDDGLITLEEGEDFNGDGCGDGDTYLVDGETMPSLNVKYGEVNAFKVRYGKQNQSMFENIEINSREFPETNESLAILSNLAKDESNSTPIPKAQNLYNLYENRAYSTKITMLGNAMIQPTHYFELTNIPLFSGSYVVLNVEHTIRPNHMKTTFNGVRILRYPNPIVDNFAESIGMLLGISSSDEDVFGNRESEDNIISIDSNEIPNEAKYNSMHPNNDKTLLI